MHIARGLTTHSPGERPTRSKPRLTRASGPRVRTGCRTCKARRVKCDERKPTCDRCAKAHRKCDGYDEQALASASEANSESAWTTNVSKESQPPGSSMPFSARNYQKSAENSTLSNIRWDPSPLLIDASQSNLTYEERWFLNFFRHTTAQTNAIYFYKPFWGMLIYQASEVQPAARHAVIGIGSLHWGSMMDPDFAASGQMVSFSLRQCNKALNYMSGNLTDGTSRRTRMETVLVSCAILVALAFGQGDAPAGGRHIRAGFGLLHEWQKVKMDDSPIGSVLLGTFYQIFLDWPALIDVDDGSRSYSYPHQLVGGDQVGSLIETPEEACGVLLILGWLLLQIKPHSLTHTFYDSVPFAVLKRLRLWRYSILEQNNFQPLPFLSQEKRETIVILDIWRNVILIKGISDDRIAKGEMRYDDYLSYFQDTVRQAGELLAQGSLRSIWFKSGIVAPLFFCAFKCRDWDTRREALDLLTGWSSDKGIWSISKTALVLGRLIRIESQSYEKGQTIPRDARIDSVRVEFEPRNTEVKFMYRRPVCMDGTDCQFDVWKWDGEFIPY